MRDELDIPMPAMAPSYRPSSRRHEAMDPATKRLTIFASVIGAALLALVAAWAFTGHHHGVPVIEADSRPVKVKPANPGGMQVEGANDAILSGESDGKETAAPGPETPAPQALKAQEAAAAQAAQPAPAATTALAQPGAVADTPVPAEATPAEQHPLPALRPHLAARVANPPPGSTANDGAASIRLIPGAKGSGPVAAAPRGPIPLTPQTTPAPQPGAIAQAAPAQRVAQASLPAASVLGAAHGRRTLVQLAAVPSDEAAKTEWQRLAKKYPDLFNGRAPSISKTEHDGKTYWRVRTAGFTDEQQAAAFCDKLKARGSDCRVF